MASPKLTNTANSMMTMLNTVRSNSSEFYKERIPEATLENISQIGSNLIDFSIAKNEFLNAFFNRIALVIYKNRQADNPLSILKKGQIPYGNYISEVHTNPATAKKFNSTSTNLLAQTLPDVKSCFYEMNRQDMYTVTISNDMLRTAFSSYESLNNFVEVVINSLYSGNYIDEFTLMKSVFTNAVTENQIPTLALPKISKNNVEDFVTISRKIFRDFTIPSTNWNAWKLRNGDGNPRTTWTNPEDIYFILNTETESHVSVECLAKAYNLDKANLLGHILVIDDFGVDKNKVQSSIQAIMFDKSLMQIYSNKEEMTYFENPENLTINYYLHIWQTYGISPFANCVAFTTDLIA